MSIERRPATIIGGPVSPYVRKVLTVCEMKGVPYRLDPIVPFFGNDMFSELSPFGASRSSSTTGYPSATAR